jgi:hypothetical protein
MISFGILAAGIAYGGWTAQRTALDPSATDKLAHELLMSEPVQRELTDKVQQQVRDQYARTDLDPEIRSAVQTAIADPRFADAFAAAITEIHKQLLGDGSEKVVLDTGPVTKAVADALYSVDPTLSEQIRSQPIEVDLGDANLPNLGKARDTARTVTWMALAMAIVLLAGAVAVHPSPRDAVARIGRRIAFLSFGPFLMFVGVPWLLHSAQNDTAQVLGDELGVYRARVLPSAIVLLVGGLATWIIARSIPKPEEPEVPAFERGRAGPADWPPQPPMPMGDPRVTEQLYL